MHVLLFLQAGCCVRDTARPKRNFVIYIGGVTLPSRGTRLEARESGTMSG